MSDTSITVTGNEPANRDTRWPRLFAGFLSNVIWFGLGSFVGECIWYLWKHSLAVGGLTVYSVFLSFANALGFGLFCGLFIGFSKWLAQELFDQPRPDSPERQDASLGASDRFDKPRGKARYGGN